MRTLMWFRQDLRVFDNPALYRSSLSEDGVVAVYFVTKKIWKKNGYGDAKINFLFRNVTELKNSLAKYNISLLIREANDFVEIRSELVKIAKKYKLEGLYVNRSSDDVAKQAVFNKIVEGCLKSNLPVFLFDEETILTPGSVLTLKETPYSVFTPFKRQWIKVFNEKYKFKILGSPKKQKKKLCASDKLNFTTKNNLLSIAEMWPAGEQEAKKRLKFFIGNSILDYKNNRNYPFLDGTSKLSPYLSCGTISVRECLKKALDLNNGKLDSGKIGVTSWISELIWRDFYKHLAYYFPRMYDHYAFKMYTDKIDWSKDRKLFNSWKNGKTGFPIVDAAMHQLNETGWMHNRLRMVAASFLTKLLQIDWRLGEKYFAEKLIDYDFSANNGGWQWSASTGADSVPYFRIFNPELQQKKYDPKSEFINLYLDDDYFKKVKPIIDYKKAREKSLKLWNKK